MNIDYKERLLIPLIGKQRERFEKTLLPTTKWEENKECMPPQCRDVVTGEAFYCGLEGIGHSEATGWYLVLWNPIDDPEPQNTPIGNSGLTVAGVQILNGTGPSTLTLLFIENPLQIFIVQDQPAEAPSADS